MSKVLLEAQDLSKHFPIRAGILKREVGRVHAVNHVNFELFEGETLGIVGESGCGKSTLGRTLVRLYEPTTGTIQFDGQDLTAADKFDLKKIRRDIQMIFQDPYASLNPRMSVGKILEEPLALHNIGTPKERQDRVKQLLDRVGLPQDAIWRYPHEFSGGQRQRIGIARAIALNPKIVICDEAVSALDVSIQAQVLNLLVELQKELGLTYIFISHDLAVVRYISDRVAVMYLGEIVEMGTSEELYANPRHPYTQALLSALPVPDPTKRGSTKILAGDVPSPSNPPPGCSFNTRCPYKTDVCTQDNPALNIFPNTNNHYVACHHAETLNQDN